MAINITAVETNGSVTNAQSYATASVAALSAGEWYEMDVVNEHFGGAQADTASVDGSAAGLTFSPEATTIYGPGAGSLSRVTRVKAPGPSSAGVLTINIAGSSNKQCAWNVKKVTGADPATLYAQASVTNNSDGVGAPNNLAVSLPGLIDAVNGAVSVAFGTDGEVVTPDTGFTEAGDAGGAGREVSVQGQWKLPGQTTCTSSDLTAFSDIGAIISEIKAAGGGGGGATLMGQAML